MMGFQVSQDLNDIVTKAVQNYLSKDGKGDIQKQIDITLKERDEVNARNKSLKSGQMGNVNGVYGKVILNSTSATHTNDNLLQDMKNKINYGVTTDPVSSNNGSMNYKGF